MNNFVYDIPTKVYFGKNQIEGNLSNELKKYGNRILLVYGGGSIKKIGLYDRVVGEIKNSGLELFELAGIAPNPRVDSVREGAKICKENKINVVLAVGGGSVIDASKWIAAAACVNHDAWEFFSKWAPVEKALPIFSILTLSATGSEMDSGGVISNPETNDKIGRLSQILYPKVSFLDPTNTYSVSEYQTACGAVDILSHIFETYFTMEKDFYMIDSIMESLMKTVIKYTPIALKEPENYEARANLMWASSWALNGFIKSGKKHAWSCHPIEHELSAYYDITHGLGLAIITPRWMQYCLDKTTISRFVQYGVNVWGIDENLSDIIIANQAIEKTANFFYDTLKLDNSLSKIGIDKNNFKIMAQKACGGGTINGLKPLNQKDIEKILEMCL